MIQSKPESLTILFDIGSTLLETKDPSIKTSVLALIHQSLPVPENYELRTELKRLLFKVNYKDSNELANVILTYANLNHMDNGWKNEERVYKAMAEIWQSQIDNVRPTEGSIDLLESLQARGHSIGVYSNLWVPFYEAYLHYFKKPSIAFLSYQIGEVKPDKAFYEPLIEYLKGRKVVVIGDTYYNDIAPLLSQPAVASIWLLSRPKDELRSILDILSGVATAPNATVASLAELDYLKIENIYQRLEVDGYL